MGFNSGFKGLNSAVFCSVFVWEGLCNRPKSTWSSLGYLA